VKNKLTVLFILLTIFLVSNVVAQSHDKGVRGTSISISGGYTNSTVYGTMEERHIEYFGKLDHTNRGSLAFGLHFHKPLNKIINLKYGVGYIQKQVNPQENAGFVYPDVLKMGYLSIPLLMEVNLSQVDKPINLSAVFGPMTNFMIMDKSFTGPDRNGSMTKAATISLTAGAILSIALDARTKLLVQYNYIHDITSARLITMPSGAYPAPNKDYSYKFKTNCISLGFQWPLHKQ
jgi:hypothetical protein